jgi:hypothetical protein
MVDTYVVAVGDKLLHFSEGLVHESHVHDDLVQQCVALHISDNVKGTQKDRQKRNKKGEVFACLSRLEEFAGYTTSRSALCTGEKTRPLVRMSHLTD